ACDHDVLDLQIGQRLLQDPCKIFEHDDGLCAGIGELEFQFARLVERIDVYDGAAGSQYGGDGDRILQHVRHHDGDPCTVLQPKALQPGCQGTGCPFEVGIGQ